MKFNIIDWLQAARIRTLPLSFSTVLMGSGIAYYHNFFDLKIFLLTIFTVMGLQILSNFANDFGDNQKGTDNLNRVGPKRTIQEGKITPVQMKIAIIVTTSITFILGTTLLWMSLKMRQEIFILFLFIGIVSIRAAIKYTMGKNPYGYAGWGDFVVFIFFGLGTLGITYLFTHSFELLNILPSITMGSLSVSVLNLNNMRDIVNDKVMKKMTVAVLLGFQNAKIYHGILLFTSFFALNFYILFSNLPKVSYLSFLPVIYLLYNLKKIYFIDEPQLLDPFLKKTTLSTLLISVLLWIGV